MTFLDKLRPAIAEFLKRYFEPVDWSRTRSQIRLTVILMLVLFIVTDAIADPYDRENQTVAIIRNERFNFETWEATAVLNKAQADLIGAHRYLSEEDRSQYVRDYLDLVNRIADLEYQINQIYTDPAITNPEAASLSQRTQRDILREQQAQRQPVAEAIIESQIAATLVDMGFGIGGQILPPVRIRFTQLPMLLIVSPRDHIERVDSQPLQTDLPVDALERLEKRVDSELDVSSLAVPLGGLAMYPAMLIESGYAPHIYDIGGHEWAHHYLGFYPLGANFGATPDLFTINETVASIFGGEVGRATLERYYPDLLPPPPVPPDLDTPNAPPPPEPEPPAFDFNAEMRETRIRVDDLLAEGEIEAAEAYMEARRKVFVENGYQIRKLNQAYFAFYGLYADEPGATGEDPVGPAVRELRNLSPSLYEFITTIRGMTTLEEIQTQIERLQSQG